jgi:chorismate dehydratase
VQGQPSGLNAMLRDGRLDLCPSSSIEYALHQKRYLLLPRFCIGSLHAIWSIRLFSKLPLEQLDRKSLILTGESDTSAVLCRVILNRFMGFQNEFATEIIDLEDALDRADAVLLIGDRALAAHKRAGNLYSYDLGSFWNEKTGLPFVFALWTMNEDAAVTKAAELEEFWQALCEAHRRLSAPDEEMIESAVQARPFMTHDSVVRYWRLISYEMSESHLEGLELFYRLAYEIGELETLPELRFFEPKKNIF